MGLTHLLTSLGVAGSLVIGGCAADNGGVEESTDFPLPTNEWRPGEPGKEALLTGTVRLDDRGCLVVGGLPVLWPSGYTAFEDAAGAIHIHDQNGVEVAITGHRVTAGGGADGPARFAPCEGDYETYFSIQSTIEPLAD